MLIRFHGPFERLAEKEVTLKVEGSINLRQLLQQLVSIYPKLPFHEATAMDGELSSSVIFAREGRSVTLGDTLGDEDILDIFIPLTGG
jgi:hypothetical protein